jgi:2-polyprenyl-3-methyl-5-hydroxy-6-metoxy-1,4-benzoquinol methylase
MSGLFSQRITRIPLIVRFIRLISWRQHISESTALMCLLVAVLISLGCGHSSPEAEQDRKEISVRNVTRDSVTYSVTRVGGDGKPEQKTLPPGAIHRYPSDVQLDVGFPSEGKTVTYRLNPGRPYTFRYNEHDQLDLYDGSHGRADVADLAPFVPTPMPVVEGMLMLAKVAAGDVIYDLGCGDGRIVITAAKKFGARGVGVELDPQLIEKCREGARREGVEKLAQFRMEDATRTDISDATVVALYLLPESNELLRGRLEQLLKPGTRIVTHNYPIPGWESRQANMVIVKAEDGETHSVYLYRR